MKKTIKDYQKEIKELKKQNEIQDSTISICIKRNDELAVELANEKEAHKFTDNLLYGKERDLEEANRNLIYENGVVRGLMSAILCSKGIIPDFKDIEGYKSKGMFEKEEQEKGIYRVK